MAGRFGLQIANDSNDTWGWNGALIDRETKTRHPLIKTYVEYILHGEIGYGHCAFDTKAELVAAAQRKARRILKAA